MVDDFLFPTGKIDPEIREYREALIDALLDKTFDELLTSKFLVVREIGKLAVTSIEQLDETVWKAEAELVTTLRELKKLAEKMPYFFVVEKVGLGICNPAAVAKVELKD